MKTVLNEIRKIRWIKVKELVVKFFCVMAIFLFSIAVSSLFNGAISALMRYIYAF